MFGASNNTGFGGFGAPTTPAGGGGFGGGFQTPQQGGFGAPQQQQQQPLFGSTNQGFQQQQPQQQGGLFGQPQQQQGGGMFGQPTSPWGATAPAAPVTPGGGFGNTPAFGAQPAFGGPQQQQTAFGAQPAFGAPQQQQSAFGAPQQGMRAEMHNPGNETELKREDRFTDSITSVKFSTLDGSMVSIASWDGTCKVFQLTPKDYSGQSQVNLKATLPTTLPTGMSPILDTCWRTQSPTMFTAQANGTVAMWDLGANQLQQVGRHDAGVKTVHWIQDMNCLVTGGWDKTVRYWDLRQPNPVETLPMLERVHCMAVRFPTEVVVCAPVKVGGGGGVGMFSTAKQDELKVPCILYDLRNFKNPIRDSFVSSQSAQQLPKLPVRTVSISTDGSFFACAGTEGRVVIQHINEAQKAQNFTFRGHKHEDMVNKVSTTIHNPINDIQFHPHSNVFATCGSDGTFCFWDHVERSRLYHGPQLPAPAMGAMQSKDLVKRCQFPNGAMAPILCSAFNVEGSVYAYAVGYDWGGGMAYNSPQDQINTVVFHSVSPNEVKPGAKAASASRGFGKS